MSADAYSRLLKRDGGNNIEGRPCEDCGKILYLKQKSRQRLCLSCDIARDNEEEKKEEPKKEIKESKKKRRLINRKNHLGQAIHHAETSLEKLKDIIGTKQLQKDTEKLLTKMRKKETSFQDRINLE